MQIQRVILDFFHLTDHKKLVGAKGEKLSTLYLSFFPKSIVLGMRISNTPPLFSHTLIILMNFNTHFFKRFSENKQRFCHFKANEPSSFFIKKYEMIDKNSFLY